MERKTPFLVCLLYTEVPFAIRTPLYSIWNHTERKPGGYISPVYLINILSLNPALAWVSK
jgi:hypothetical protein